VQAPLARLSERELAFPNRTTVQELDVVAGDRERSLVDDAAYRASRRRDFRSRDFGLHFEIVRKRAAHLGLALGAVQEGCIAQRPLQIAPTRGQAQTRRAALECERAVRV